MKRNGAKKHIGLVIGEGYNCPKEVISENGKGIEQYSYTSLLYKAFQQYIEKSEKRDKQQDNIIKNLQDRLEKLEQEVQNGKN